MVKLTALLFFGACHFLFETCSAISAPQFSPEPTWPDRYYYDEDGPQIKLQCRVAMVTNTTILWYRDGAPLHTDSTLVINENNETLTLWDPKSNQTGHYTCLVHNMAGNISYSGNILITAAKQETRPRIVETDPESFVKYARIGEQVNISCVFDVGGSNTALMDLSMNWYKNTTTVNDTNHSTWGINTSHDNNQVFSLVIDKLQPTDYGVYECYGENSKGNISKNITVAPPKPITKSLPLYVIICISAGGAVVVIATVVTAIVLRHRYKIHKLRQKYDTLEWEEPDVTQYDVPREAPQYDVFISYSSDDLTWVKDVLFHDLCSHGYTVFIDFKDFTPGYEVSENIMDGIYKSRKTIVVMSSNFLKSMWGQFELQQAHNRAITQRQDVLVLIKHNECKVPARLMGKTFLDWTDISVRPHFWSRLYEALGEPGKFGNVEVNTEPLPEGTEKNNGNIETQDINSDAQILTSKNGNTECEALIEFKDNYDDKDYHNNGTVLPEAEAHMKVTDNKKTHDRNSKDFDNDSGNMSMENVIV